MTSDDYVTRFPETTNGKSIAININYDSKDFKIAVFEILVKANSLGSGWKVKGPVKVEKYMFTLNLDKGFADNLPQGVNGFSIELNNTE